MSTPADALRQIVDAPQYQRGAGPDQLPYGQAQGLNDAATGLPTAPQGTALPDAGAPPGGSAPVPPSGAEQPAQMPFKAADDSEAFLASPSTRPGENPLTMTAPQIGLPPGSETWAAAIHDDAARPDATLWVKTASARLAELQRLGG